MRKRLIQAGATAAALAALAGGGVAWATAGDDEDEQVSGPSADRARAAALAHTGGGKVTSVEGESEEGSAFQVEIEANGKTVEVLLDASYNVVGVESEDGEGADTDD
ncbi:MAG: PepSY domain-containing protein [Gaiellaceae bacterium]